MRRIVDAKMTARFAMVGRATTLFVLIGLSVAESVETGRSNAAVGRRQSGEWSQLVLLISRQRDLLDQYMSEPSPVLTGEIAQSVGRTLHILDWLKARGEGEDRPSAVCPRQEI
jgi:hypothetical protein